MVHSAQKSITAGRPLRWRRTCVSLLGSGKFCITLIGASLDRLGCRDLRVRWKDSQVERGAGEDPWLRLDPGQCLRRAPPPPDQKKRTVTISKQQQKVLKEKSRSPEAGKNRLRVISMRASSDTREGIVGLSVSGPHLWATMGVGSEHSKTA